MHISNHRSSVIGSTGAVLNFFNVRVCSLIGSPTNSAIPTSVMINELDCNGGLVDGDFSLW